MSKHHTPEQKAQYAVAAAAKRRRINPSLPPYTPRPATHGQVKGPSGEHAQNPPVQLAAGQELQAQTIKVNADGTLNHRYDKSRTAREDAVGPVIPPSHLITKTTSHVDASGRVDHQYFTSKPEKVAQWRAFEAAVERLLAGVPAAQPMPEPAGVCDLDLMGMLNWGDSHFGMLSWGEETGADHDLTIATRDFRMATKMAIDRAPMCARFLLVNQGDLFHAQDDRQVTPRSGHKLDVDTRFAKIFERVLEELIVAVDYALARFKRVKFVGIPGNHDPMMAFMVASYLRAWYRNEPRVDIDPGRKPFAYEVFGDVLLGFAHGPSVTRIERLPGIMTTDQAEAWGRAKFREWHIGDIHHVTAREFAGVTVWSHGILPPKDAWTNEAGYRAEQRMMQTTFHRKYGRRTVNVVTLAEVRETLRAGGA
jgi:hypothetical protein